MTRLVETPLSGCVIVEFDRRGDDRGWFQRAVDVPALEHAGVPFVVEQANFARTARRGTVRGMHYQRAPHGEAKLFHCVAGAVFDVAVDLRESSPTFGSWFGVELRADEPRALLIPVGFAHGYLSLEDEVQVAYFASHGYAAKSERVLSPFNETVGIQWPIAIEHLSDKDRAADPAAAPIPSGY
jgi:dTDP-4-dehydrorhamnose 3,5-epimerase and related enzymes